VCGERMFYVKDKYLRLHEFGSGRDVPVVSLRRGGHTTPSGLGNGPRSLAYNSFSAPTDSSVLITSVRVDAPSDFFFSFFTMLPLFRRKLMVGLTSLSLSMPMPGRPRSPQAPNAAQASLLSSLLETDLPFLTRTARYPNEPPPPPSPPCSL
jgi:hypothetical protein